MSTPASPRRIGSRAAVTIAFSSIPGAEVYRATTLPEVGVVIPAAGKGSQRIEVALGLGQRHGPYEPFGGAQFAGEAGEFGSGRVGVGGWGGLW